MQQFILITVIVLALGCGKKNPEGNRPRTGGLVDLFDTNSTGNEYKTSEDLKAKVDKHFGLGSNVVRFFVAADASPGNLKREVMCTLPPPLDQMALFTLGHLTACSMPSKPTVKVPPKALGPCVGKIRGTRGG